MSGFLDRSGSLPVLKQSLNTLRSWAKRLKSDIYALYLAMRDARTPAYARWFAVIVVAYALSPIDLIPDFIPVLGLLDDLILLPISIALLKKMIPTDVMAYSQHRAQALLKSGLPASRNAAMVIVTIWALVLTAVILWFTNRITSPSVVSDDVSVPASRQTDDKHPVVPRSNGTSDANRSRNRDRE